MLSVRVQDPRIHVFPVRLVLAVVNLDPQLRPVERLPERRNAAVKPAFREDGERRDHDRAFARRRADPVGRGSQVPEDAADRLDIRLPGGGERDAAASPDEKLDAQIALQQPHVPADGARCDALFSRGLQEAFVPARRFEGLERVQGERALGLHGSGSPTQGSAILSHTRRAISRGQSSAQTASNDGTGPAGGLPERAACDP